MNPRIRLIGVALFGALMPASPSSAQDFNAPSSPCKTDVTTPDLVSCFSRALKASDARLNDTYERIMQVLVSDDRRWLVQAERAWVQYRDATCIAERKLFDGGTAAFPAELACREAETQARIASLKRAYGWRVEKFGK